MDQDLASRQEARDLSKRTRAAFESFRHASQREVDRVCHAMVEAGFRESRRLAEMAVSETGIGRVDSKTKKNEFSTRGLWSAIHDLKTAGLIRADESRRVYEYADPFGVVAAIIPTTNPTSTALFKAIIGVKARNGVVCSPHPRAIRCIAESIRVVHDAAVSAGAPKDLVTCMTTVSLEGTDELMRSADTDLILATGGSGLVKAAYSSGKPAFGVGPGNSPAYVDRSADLDLAARAIVDSQTFDNGTICASEQSLVLDRPIREAFLAAMRRSGAHLCSSDEATRLGRIVMKGRGMNPDIVGRYPHELARMAGFEVPKETTVLLADCAGVGPEHPLSIEKLCPILSVFTEDGWEAACHRCIEVLRFGGMGHTLAIHCRDERIIREFAEKKPVNRMVVNSPSSQGAVGFTTHLFPSMTLGCGSFGGNITSDNIGPLHLLNIKRLAWVRPEYATNTLERTLFAEHAPTGTAGSSTSSAWSEREIHGGGHPASEADIRRMIEEALASKRADGCPFGRCADCPPPGVTCSHGQVSR